MKEIFVLAPGISGSELIRTLAQFGCNTLAMRVMGPAELSRTALMRSGISLTEQFLTRREEPSVIYSFLKTIPYFESASFTDAENLAKALHTMRGLIPKDEETELQSCLRDGEFPEKNRAILQVYEKYLEHCRKNKRIDTESLIRIAIEKAKPLKGEVLTLKEYPGNPLEQALAQKLSDGKAREASLTELLHLEKKPISGLSYTRAYGASNEAEHILSEIYEKKIPLDECVIATADTGTYSQLFYDLSQQYEIPMTFGSGLPILNSNPARLLKLLTDWNETRENGIDSLEEIVFSPAFDRKKLTELLQCEKESTYRELTALCEMAGSLRISFDYAANRERIRAYRALLEQNSEEKKLAVLKHTELLAGELEKGIVPFLEKFSRIRRDMAGRLDRAAMQVIAESLNAYFLYAPQGTLSEIVPEILNKTVCSEISREGCLHVTTIPGAMASLRKNLRVCGLSAAEFPGSPRENYLLLDSDLKAFGDEAEMPTSARRIRQKKEELENLVSLAANLSVPTELSYSDHDLAELKEQNPSSALYHFYREEHRDASMEDFGKALHTVEFFQSELDPSRLAGKACADGIPVGFSNIYPKIQAEKTGLEREWSFSSLNLLRQCPRRFFLRYLMGIPEKETDDPYCVIGADKIGEIAHGLMQRCSSSQEPVTKKELLENAEKAFDDFLAGRPPVIPGKAEEEKKEFLEMMGNAWELESSNEVISTEKMYRAVHASGLRLSGQPDRVERTPDGACIIEDYKTKRKIEHIKDDPDSCLQILMYMWLCEQAGIANISRGEYLYFRKNKRIPCEYSEENRAFLDQMLSEFKAMLEEGSFPRNPGKGEENCRYCKLGDICRWPGDEDKKEAQDRV